MAHALRITMASSIESRENEFYSTPYIMTKKLLDKISFNKNVSILEPCCGSLAIVDILKKYNYQNITYFDLFPQHEKIKKRNFFSYKEKHDIIITNPPFSKAYPFLTHSLNLAEIVVFLMPLDYLHGIQRYKGIYSKNLLDKVLIFVQRIILNESPAETVTFGNAMSLAWFIFNRNSIDKETILEFIYIEKEEY